MSRRKYAQAAHLKSSSKRPNDIGIHIASNGHSDNRISTVRAPASQGPGREAIAIFRRHAVWIAALVAAAAGAASLFLMMREPAYTSAAIFQRVFMVETAKGEERASLEAAAIVKGQMFRLQSSEFSRHVVDRMIDVRASGEKLSALYPSIFGHLKDEAVVTSHDRDIANKRLSSRLSVWNEGRTYVIVVSYTGVTPDEAARVANLVIAEHERTNAIQDAASARSAAQSNIQKLSLTLGPRHPLMMRAVADLASVDARLQAAEAAPPMQDRQLLETGDVIPARAVTIQSAMGRTSIMAFAILLSLVVALIAVCLLEYRSIERMINRHLAQPGRMGNEALHT